MSSHEHLEKSFHKKEQEILNFISEGRCKHFYLDFGTNIGIQIRKLYEPSLFPGAPAHSFFNETFGSTDPKYICAVGFEPNVIQRDRLEQLENSYREVGFPCTIFTETAIYGEEKYLTFYRDDRERDENHEWGSSLVKWKTDMTATSYEVLAINTCSFMHTIMHKWHSVNYNEAKSRIMVKMDIEGAEFVVIPHLIVKGCLCYMNYMTLEWHNGMAEPDINAAEIMEMLRSTSKYAEKLACHFHVVDADDETFRDASFPLPHKSTTTIVRRILKI